MSSLKGFGLMAVAVVIGLLSMTARAEQADTGPPRCRLSGGNPDMSPRGLIDARDPTDMPLI